MDISLKSVNVQLCPLIPLKGPDKGGMHSVPFHKLVSIRRDKTKATTDAIILQATSEVNSSGTTIELSVSYFYQNNIASPRFPLFVKLRRL